MNINETKLKGLPGINKSLRMKVNFLLKRLKINVKEISDFGNKLIVTLNVETDAKQLNEYLKSSGLKMLKHPNLESTYFISI